MIRTLKLLSRSAFVILWFLTIGLVNSAAAQDSYVEGFSRVLESTSSSEIDTSSETFITPDIAVYYDAYVEGYLYDNNTLIAAGCVSPNYQYDGCTPASYVNDAYGEFHAPLVVGDIYTIESDHYVIAYYIYGYDYYGNPLYWNPNYFFVGNDGGTPDPSGWNYTPGGGPVYYDFQYLYLGTTGVQISSAAPHISGISPTGATRGTSGSITINGSNLIDLFTGATIPAITGSGVSLSIQSQDPNQVVLNYSVASNAGSGARSLTLSTRFGISNAASFNVGDPTPHITSLSPSTWNAGTSITVTITGTGFGTNMPTVSVSSGTGIGVGAISSYNDTQISVGISVSPDAPSESVTLQVQSNGYGGSGFIATTPGQSQSGSSSATVQPIQPTPPTITLDGQTVSGTTQHVFVGQRIALTGSFIAPGGTHVTSAYWSGPDPAGVTGGFGNGAGGGPDTTRGVELPMPNQTCATGSSSCNFTFYYVVHENADPVVFSFALSNGQQASSQVTFNVDGPTGSLLPNAFVQTDDSASVVLNAQGNPATLRMTNAPGRPSAGIWFNELATLPVNNSGTFIWVQILNSVTFSQIAPTNTGYIPPTPATMGLDGIYPYPSLNILTSDTPSRGDLLAGLGEAAEAFDATMYVLWDPALPAGCTPATTDTSQQIYTSTPSTCTSIPVPLASVHWTWKACAINESGPPPTGPSWFRQCGPGHADPPKANGYPQWSACNSSAHADCQH
jgi:hypothetical protein